MSKLNTALDTDTQAYIVGHGFSCERKDPSQFYLDGKLSGIEFNNIIEQIEIAAERFVAFKAAILILAFAALLAFWAVLRFKPSDLFPVVSWLYLA